MKKDKDTRDSAFNRMMKLRKARDENFPSKITGCCGDKKEIK
jgi:hypothetical protein